MTRRSIAAVGPAVRRPGSDDFRAANISSRALGRDIDPVIGFDHFHMRQPIFAPHPHAGFSAVTYLFEDGEGDFVSEDSLGNRVVAKPGSVIWMTAGRGVVHNEYPAVPGELSHGLQIFVDLPEAAKRQPPRLLFVDGPDVVIRDLAGTRVRIVAGQSGGVSAALDAPAGTTLLDVMLEPGAGFEEAIPADQSALLYVVRGQVMGSGRELRALDAASFSVGEGSISFRAGSDGAQVVVLAGRPVA